MNKTLKSRIQNKRGTDAEWKLATNFVPLKGEQVVYEADSDNESPRIKIGDGNTNVNSLPFAEDVARLSSIPNSATVRSANFAMEGEGGTVGNQTYEYKALGWAEDDVLNLEDGSGANSIQQKQDGTTGTIDFTGKNPNATALDSTLTGQIAYGGTGAFSTSFGGKSQASGKRSFAAGTTTVAKGAYSAAFGDNSVALGTDSFAEGIKTTAAGVGSHSEGSDTIAKGWGSHVEGYMANANGDVSHAEGCRTESNGIYSHTEGYASKTITTLPTGSGGGGTGGGTTPVEPDNWNDDDNLGAMSHAEGGGNLTYGVASHAEGKGNITYGHRSHAEGRDNTAGGILNNKVTGEAAHVEGRSNAASGNYSHAQGFNTKATGESSFSAGQHTLASGNSATAFGSNTVASGENSFAAGSASNAIAVSSFAAGDHVNANHNYSSALGQGLITGADCQTVIGLNNKVSSNSYFVVGNGTSGAESNKSNAFEVLIDGRAKVQTAPQDNEDVVRKKELDTKQANLVSGTNIKTVNGFSLLGSGNITISSGPIVAQSTGTSTTSVMSQNAVTTELGKKITAPNGWTGSGYGMNSVLTRFDVDGQTGMQFIRTKLNSDGAGDGIIGYDGTGHCEVSTPNTDLQAANKKYVDNKVANSAPFEANIQWGGKNLSGNYSPIDAALIPTLGPNRFALMPAEAITVEYTRDGGTTWLDYGASDDAKRAFVTTQTSFVIGKGDNTNKGASVANALKYKLRVTIDNSKSNLYSEIWKYAIYCSTNGNNDCAVSIDYTTYDAQTTWTNLVDKQKITGWSGYNIINPQAIVFGKNLYSKPKVRFTFESLSSTVSEEGPGLAIYNLYGYGGVGWETPSILAARGVPYEMIASNSSSDDSIKFTGKLIDSNNNTINAVSANPGGSGTTLTTLKIDSSIYSIPQTPTDYVKTWGVQTVGGAKTFSSAITCSSKGSKFSDIRIQNGGSPSGGYIYFGDGTNAYIAEINDDILTIYGKKGIKINTSNNSSYPVTINNVALNGVVANPAGTGTTALTSLQVGSTIYSIPSYTLPTATSSTLGGIKTGFTNMMNSFAVETQTDGTAYVTIPLQSTVGTSDYAIMSQNAVTTAIETAITNAVNSALSTPV